MLEHLFICISGPWLKSDGIFWNFFATSLNFPISILSIFHLLQSHRFITIYTAVTSKSMLISKTLLLGPKPLYPNAYSTIPITSTSFASLPYFHTDWNIDVKPRDTAVILWAKGNKYRDKSQHIKMAENKDGK